jgi:hypothetical protein
MSAIDLLERVQETELELACVLALIVQEKVDALADETGLDIGEVSIHLARAPLPDDDHYNITGVTIEHGLPGRLSCY